jgi:hypothetical protein
MTTTLPATKTVTFLEIEGRHPGLYARVEDLVAWLDTSYDDILARVGQAKDQRGRDDQRGRLLAVGNVANVLRSEIRSRAAQPEAPKTIPGVEADKAGLIKVGTKVRRTREEEEENGRIGVGTVIKTTDLSGYSQYTVKNDESGLEAVWRPENFEVLQ